MGKDRLLITDKIDEQGLVLLEKHFQIEKRFGILAAELLRSIGDYTAVITRSPTAITGELLNRAPELKIIGRAGIGVDNIDIQAATRYGVAVINAPKGNARSTAEHTIGMLFSLLRHIPHAFADLQNGIWGKQKYVGTQVQGKTLGIIGYGNVGKEVGKLARGIGMKVIVCEPYLPLPRSVKKVTFETLLVAADVITLHVPATYLTHHMMNTHTLALCKPGAYLINCSRGAVVDEQAVLAALESGKLGGFAVDVYQQEPRVNPRLLRCARVVATPHIAGSTNESQRESVHEVVAGIMQYLQGQAPTNLLNPQVFHKAVSRRPLRFAGFDTVIFDCDSTLCAIEGIDELAAMKGKKPAVAKLTRQAMEGAVSFETVYRKRLEIIRPSLTDIRRLGQLYIDSLVEDAKGTVAVLQKAGKRVYIISSGLWPALEILASYLSIPPANVFGNELVFDERGDYLDMMEGPLIRNHGKLQIIRQLKGRKLLVGDSVTDLECREVVDTFVGYGGVVVRAKVEKESDVFLRANSFAPILAIATGFADAVPLLTTSSRRYIGKGIDLLFHPAHAKISPAFLPRLDELKRLAYY